MSLAGNIGGSASSATWTGGTGGSYSPNPTTLNASYVPTTADSLAGTVTLTLTTNDPAGVCPAVNDQMVITINQPAVARANSDQSICYGSNVTLAGMIEGSATSGTWSGGAGSFTPDAITLGATYVPTTADSTAGTVTLTLTSNDPAGVCPAVNDQMVITINQPAVSLANADQNICYGSAVTMAGAVSGSATSGTWSGGTGSFAPNAATLSASYTPTSADSLAGAVTLTLTTNDPTGVCPAVNDQMTITINQPAVALANADQSICYGATVTLAGVISGSSTNGTWTGGTGTFSPDSITLNATYIPTVADSTAGTVTLTLTSNDPAGVCPAVTNQMIITINQPATANANVNQTICYGSPVVLSGSVGGSATSGTWSDGAGSFIPDSVTLGATYIPTAADSAAQVVILTLTTNDPAGVCPAVTDQMVISINQPALAFANADQTICFGNAVTLAGAVGGSAAGATWTGGTGIFSPDSITLNANYIPTSVDSAAGTVTLTLTTDDPASVCPAVADQMTITINQPAAALANANQTICYGTAVTLAGSIGGSATTGTWSGGTGLFTPNATSLNAGYTPTSADSTAGVITLTLTTDDPTGICPAVNDTMTITINQPAIAQADSNQVICFGNAVTLAGSIGGSATNGTWTGGTGSFLPNANTLNASYVPTSADSAAGSVTLTLTTDDPASVCPAVSDQMTITMNQPAMALANTSQTICYGSPVTLAGAIGGSASSGTWSGGTGSYIPNASNLSAGYTPTSADSAAGVITLTLTTNDPVGVCPAVNDTMTITINQPAVALASTDVFICFGGSVTLNGAVAGSATGGTWTGGTGTFSPDSITLNASYTPTLVDSIAGSVVLTLTTNDPSGVCAAVKDSMTIFMNQPPIALANTDQTICFGNAVTLAGAVGGSASSGTWSGGTGTFSPNATTLGANYIPTSADSAAGTVTLTLTTDDPIGTCTAVSDQMTITINQPAVANASSDQTICYGSSVTLAGSIGGSAAGGTWSGGAGTFSPNATTLGASYTPTSADSAAGSITLTLTTNDPVGVCGMVSDQMLITISQPATANANTDQNICYGSAVTLAGTIGGSATNGTWTGGTGSFSPNATTLGATYTPTSADSTAGTVTLTLTTNSPGGSCVAVSDQIVITINQPATVSANSDQPICYGNPVTLAGSFGGSATSGTWSGGAGTFSPNATTPGATYTPASADSAAGSVTLTFTTNDPTGVCSSVADQVQITITPADNASFSYASTVMCQTTVNPTPLVTGLAGGNFTSSSALLNLNPSTGVVNASASAPGTYTVTYTTNGVCPKAQSATVSINSLPVANAGADSVLACGAASAALNGAGSSTGTGVTYMWNSIGGTINSGGTTLTPAVGSTGLYYIIVTNSAGCSATDSAMVTQGTISAAFTPNVTTGTAPLDVTFTNGSMGASTYTWTLGNGNSSFNTNTSTTYTAGGTYTVTLIAQAGSCVESTSATIVVTDNINLIIPNVFTPNGDGLNDLFFITATGVSDLHGDIYNRWGEQIYVLDGLSSTWDGKNLSNNSSTDGTYYLILKYKGFDGKTYDKETWITLVR